MEPNQLQPDVPLLRHGHSRDISSSSINSITPTPHSPAGAAEMADIPLEPPNWIITRQSFQSEQTLVDRVSSPIEAHASHKLVKATLLICGLLSIAQFCVTIALFVNPVVLNINQAANKFLTLLPTIANVTNKTADAWLAAAVGLVGLWAWERHLARWGASLNELEAWGGLMSGKIPVSVSNVTMLGLVPIVVFLTAVGLVAGATSAMTSALTPTVGTITVHRKFNVPSSFASDPEEFGLFCGRMCYSNCHQSRYRGFVLSALRELSRTDFDISNHFIQLEGSTVRMDALGIANPRLALSYAYASDFRGAQFSSETSFSEARMCMEGITTNPTCSRVTNQVLPPRIDHIVQSSSGSLSLWTLSYSNACGNRVTSPPRAYYGRNLKDVSACVDAQGSAHLDWVTFGMFGSDSGDEVTSIQLRCEFNVVQAAREMEISRETGMVLVSPAAKPKLSPLTPNPREILPNLTSQVNALLTELSDPNGDLPVRLTWSDDSIPALEIISGLTFTSVQSVTNTLSLPWANGDPKNSSVDNYNGGGPPGYIIPTIETYNVVLLGSGSKLWLIPLSLAIIAILASFLSLPRPHLGFDPSDPSAMVAVALNSSIELQPGQRGGLATEMDAKRRLYFGEAPDDPGKLALGLEPRTIGGRWTRKADA